MQKLNPVGWFEIPVTDMQRAMTFYQAVFGYEMQLQPVAGLEMGWFPMDETGMGAAGALVPADDRQPGAAGPKIYFSAMSGDLKNEVAKVEAAGGKIVTPITPIGEGFGFYADVEDTEGNIIGIHSQEHTDS